jgi:uncharacterized protein (DUF1697 family)
MMYAALLRGINVGGNKMVPMAELRDLAVRLGFTEPRTLLQSGNLVFEGRTQTTSKVEQILEQATKKHFGFDVTYIVRTAAEWNAVIAANPFPAEAKTDPAHLLVKFDREAPTSAAVKALQASIVGRERVGVVGREWYVVYPDGVGTSKLATTKEGRVFAASGTARNWNTVLKIGAVLG